MGWGPLSLERAHPSYEEPELKRNGKDNAVRLTHNDKLTLRRMMADACQWQEYTNTSYIEAAEIGCKYEKTLAKIVPLGPLNKKQQTRNRERV